mmetsp:Transcript_57503/g.135306  ORF Transcript_57503/g.135306 Transcript_57503/m.135306 type:complete len:271 (-) Transcript_57503:87-899(-)
MLVTSLGNPAAMSSVSWWTWRSCLSVATTIHDVVLPSERVAPRAKVCAFASCATAREGVPGVVRSTKWRPPRLSPATTTPGRVGRNPTRDTGASLAAPNCVSGDLFKRWYTATVPSANPAAKKEPVPIKGPKAKELTARTQCLRETPGGSGGLKVRGVAASPWRVVWRMLPAPLPTMRWRSSAGSMASADMEPDAQDAPSAEAVGMRVRLRSLTQAPMATARSPDSVPTWSRQRTPRSTSIQTQTVPVSSRETTCSPAPSDAGDDVTDTT